MPRVSVLLPCRNAALHLAAALSSLYAQSLADLEIIAVDDASTDATPAILRAWSARDARLRIVAGRGVGLVAALQDAVAHADGELLARMDADDVAEPERLELQLDALDRDPTLAGCGTAVRYFPRSEVKDGALRYEQWLNSLTTPAAVRRDRFIECPVAHPALMVRRSAFDAVGGYRDPGWPEDYDLVLRLLCAGQELTNLPEVMLHWREGPGRLSRTDPRYHEEAFRRCKLHHLGPVLERREGAVVWGAGPVGKAFARGLLAAGLTLRAFVDLDARKIGQTVYGARVVAPSRINEFRGAFALAAVAGPGPRAEIRASLADAGWIEETDFLAVA